MSCTQSNGWCISGFTLVQLYLRPLQTYLNNCNTHASHTVVAGLHAADMYMDVLPSHTLSLISVVADWQRVIMQVHKNMLRHVHMERIRRVWIMYAYPASARRTTLLFENRIFREYLLLCWKTDPVNVAWKRNVCNSLLRLLPTRPDISKR